jgi:hypothetical protein
MSRRVPAQAFVLMLVMALGASVASAKGQKHHPHGKKDKPATTADHRLHDTTADRRRDERLGVYHRDTYVIDRNGHRRIVTEYYSREGLPPGLAGRPLPPGLAKQLRERGHLPPGLQKRLILVPQPLASRLPPQPPYYTRYFAGRDLVVVDRRTQTVAAIIPNVLPE